MFHFVENCAKLLTPYNLQDRLGYDPYTRNDNKNSAMYDVAKLLGCENLVAKAVPMVVVNGDRVIKGTFMEHAEGSDRANPQTDDLILNIDPKVAMYNKNLYRDLADMQVIDYICGNIDRHKQNMIYKTEKTDDGIVKITGITAIDNDASFPERDLKEGEFAFTPDNPPRIYRPENFRYVNRKTANIILNLTREQLETALRGHNLKPKAIEKAWQRTQEVQAALLEMQKNNITFVEDMEEAVSTAYAYAEEGDIVALSPASASFDRYKNFELRGKHFKELVSKIGQVDGLSAEELWPDYKI